MNLLRKSQVVAAFGLVGGTIVSCTLQPYLEVFTRWMHVKMDCGKEMQPTERISRIAKSVSFIAI